VKGWLTILFCALTVSLFSQQPAGNDAVHFRAIDVYVDSGNVPLAAYQLEFSVTNVPTTIVGIESGSHKAFREPPFYDPKAMQGERVIIAAFSTEAPEHLPSGKTRVATIHIVTTGNTQPAFELKLQAAADSAGKKISATLSCGEKPK
jgi:hypothetical protein